MKRVSWKESEHAQFMFVKITVIETVWLVHQSNGILILNSKLNQMKT